MLHKNFKTFGKGFLTTFYPFFLGGGVKASPSTVLLLSKPRQTNRPVRHSDTYENRSDKRKMYLRLRINVGEIDT